MNALNTTAVKRLTELLATLGMQAGMNVDTPLSNWVGGNSHPARANASNCSTP
ncbi:hypothetical protein ACRHM7_00185 [Chromohalobacter israelensis]|uniref:hypothetical protein n=1 Tax=Chromohalobacter israelensis TaxID=141390 RepID=UPI003D7AA5B6